MSRRFELGMTLDYASNWGVSDAVREFFQNALDEEREHEGNNMLFEYDKEQGRIIVGNKNSVLEPKTLLLGQSSKRDREDLIGQHGEGYKVATVVLLRNSKGVTIYNNKLGEKWTAKVVNSKRYGAEIVVFDVERSGGIFKSFRPAEDLNLVIVISGITPEDWELCKKRNLHLQAKEKDDIGKVFETDDYGGSRVLLDKKYSGKVFVNGLFVCDSAAITLGYDMPASLIQLDRDRGLVDNFNLLYNVARVHMSASPEEFILENIDKPDFQYIASHIKYPSIDNEVKKSSNLKDMLKNKFVSENGKEAIPVSNSEDFNALRSGGYHPVMVSRVVKDILGESDLESMQDPVTDEELFENWCDRAAEFLPEDLLEEIMRLWGRR